MAQHLPPALDFQAGINLDMVGDNDLRFTVEGNSNANSPDVVESLWNVGAKIQPFIFVRDTGSGIPADELEDHYKARTTLKVSVSPADVAEAVLHFASPTRAAKSTGNILNVDGGVATAYPR
jgi:NAD(P)-dependent dehydrogenase (short-subunit alcohol dehydrogenase family)